MTRHQANLRSIYAMLCAVACFSVMDTTMKLLAAHYPSVQVAALRAIVALPLVAAYALLRGAGPTLLQVRWDLQLLRGALGIGMLSLFAFGLKRLSLAEAYTIFFVAPGMVTALSVWVLKERVNAGRWIAIVIGLLGVIVVLRPSGAGMLTLGGLAIVGAAVAYAVSAISGRILARTDRLEHMMFWLMLLMAIGAGALAAPGWVSVRAADAGVLLVLAISGFFGQIAITRAFSSGEASVVAPFEYTALAFGVAIDWLMWQALPDGTTLLGAAIIIGSGLYLVRNERNHVESEHP
ncbi:DMT family transporter [Massilia sp. TS11]|uniref:DMT family transporter n=1 Tax=Massilia sp. TS11 TaxID=2908003 RepID=UPI001EDB6BAC|nr:DMT family transporter [Massilia sp. TS11]MCG2585315.1 DMT family transporter [Massilia sp. TS11]